MNKLIEFLKGKKSYLVAVLGAIFGLLIAFGVISFTPEQYAAIAFLWVSLFGSALRAGVNK